MSDNHVDPADAASAHNDMDYGRSTQSSADHNSVESAVTRLEDQGDAELNELTQGQSASLLMPTNAGSRPREGKEPERPQVPSSNNYDGPSQGASSGIEELAGRLQDMSSTGRQGILAQYSNSEQGRFSTPDGRPDPFYDGTSPVPSTARPQLWLPIRSGHSTIGQGSGVNVTSNDGTTVESGSSNSLIDENLRRRRGHIFRTSGHGLDFTNTSHGSEGEIQSSIQGHARISRTFDDIVHPGTRHRSTSQYTSDHGSYPDYVAGPEFVVPRWQLDAEVTLCPICGTQFSFFVRKHHCRKCGRVVCSTCSPHRITIPHQFIVHPPEEPSSPRDVTSPRRALASHTTSSEVTNLDGGQRVRLCNPCVPDPNIAPPQSPLADNQPRSGPSRSHNRSISLASHSFSSMADPEPSEERPARGRRNMDYAQNGGQREPGRRSTVSSAASGSNSRLRENAPSVNRNSGRSNVGSILAANEDPASLLHLLARRHRMDDLAEEDERTMSRQRWGGSRAVTEQDHTDLCPVCHQQLPPASPDQPELETIREAHINECIEASIRGSHSSPPVPTGVSLPSSSSSLNPFGGNPTRFFFGSNHHTPTPPPRRTGLFHYHATEKDCVDDAECTICFEEFEVGVDMGRLECFCRFHYSCIQRWFQTHPGQCPVHQYDNGC